MEKEHTMKTIPMGSLAEICLGKVILKDDVVPGGNAKVASISNISDQGLRYEEMDNADVTEEDIEKFGIRNNDVLITCRGTKFRSVLVENKPAYPVIASGNLMIIRCEEVIEASIIHLYLQSAMGAASILQLNPGKSTINLGKKQLQSLEIPVMSKANKEEVICLWKQGKEKYQNTIREAEQEWISTLVQVDGYLSGNATHEKETRGLIIVESKTLMEKENKLACQENQIIRKKMNTDRLLIEFD